MMLHVGDVTVGGPGAKVGIAKFDRSRSRSTQRQSKPMSDGVWAGRDLLTSETWTFEMVIRTDSFSDVLDVSNRLEAVWLDPANRGPGVVASLDYQVGIESPGERKRVYGRLGRFDPATPDPAAEAGLGFIIAEFEVLDPAHYEAVEHSQTIGLVSESSGGIIFPLILPMMTTRTFSGVNARFIDVAGDAPTPLKVTFHGPLVDPCVTVDGLEVGLRGTVAEDLPIIVDSRANTVLRADGAQVHGRLTHRTRLDHLLVTPGRHEVAVTGESPTGTGRVTVTWQNATWGL